MVVNAHPSGLHTFGHPADLAHNLVVIRLGDGQGEPFVVNEYGEDVHSPSFDAVVVQVFGEHETGFHYYDYATRLGEDGGVDPDPGAVAVCPPDEPAKGPAVKACGALAVDEAHDGLPTGDPVQPIVRATVITDGNGTTWTYYVDDAGRVVRRVNNATGSRWDRNYDERGLLAGERREFGDRWCFAYDASRDPACAVHLPETEHHWSPQPRIRHGYQWGAHARLHAVLDPEDLDAPALVSYEWDERGNLVQARFPDGATIGYRYDERGRPVEITSPAGHRTTYAYEGPSGQWTGLVRDAGGDDPVVVTRTLDALGRVLTEEQGGRRTEYSWRADGLVTSRTETLDSELAPVVTVFEYDDLGDLVRTTGPLARVDFRYAPRGLLQSVEVAVLHGAEPPPPRTRCFRYDGRGELVEVVLPAGQRVGLDRDPAGRPLAEVLGTWGESPEAWDDLCVQPDPEEVIPGEGVFALYDVDPATGEVRSRELGALKTESYTYDGYGRLIEVRTAEVEGAPVVRYGHDALDRVGWVGVYGKDVGDHVAEPAADDPTLASLQRFSYDHLGRLTSVWSPWFVRRGEDVEVLDPDGITRTWVYRDGGPLVEVVGPHVEVTDERGRRTKMFFDGVGRTKRVVHHDGTMVELTWSDGGRQVVERRPIPSAGGEQERTFSFSAFGPLQRVEGGTAEHDVRFDLLGRPERVRASDGTYRIDYDGFGEPEVVWREAGELFEEASDLYLTLTYDRNGQVIRRTDGP